MIGAPFAQESLDGGFDLFPDVHLDFGLVDLRCLGGSVSGSDCAVDAGAADGAGTRALLALVGHLTVVGDHARCGHDGVRAHLHG